jgi:Holliday junction resolvase RusA-like endonuclease
VSIKTTIRLAGNPLPKKRPRFGGLSRKGKRITYHEQAAEERDIGWEIKRQWGRSPSAAAFRISVIFGMPIPKSISKKLATAMLDGKVHHTKMPDLDNLVKFTKDCCNGVVWVDDSQVVSEQADKVYTNHPFTLLTVWELT